jgi:hypothetical protein
MREGSGYAVRAAARQARQELARAGERARLEHAALAIVERKERSHLGDERGVLPAKLDQPGFARRGVERNELAEDVFGAARRAGRGHDASAPPASSRCSHARQ